MIPDLDRLTDAVMADRKHAIDRCEQHDRGCMQHERGLDAEIDPTLPALERQRGLPDYPLD